MVYPDAGFYFAYHVVALYFFFEVVHFVHVSCGCDGEYVVFSEAVGAELDVWLFLEVV